ncbi:OmpH family outer membrane protein [uncultured Parabacteroides sp.]|uniref:OmpH family outer membrane protein n=1 Tax=uncultured Parabacteroides sp. TaxID=512312 RepID=UPI0025E1BE9A|nr:OmpH family outer membrane protein [uncultured Parabacteroides sp.]MCD7851663.1 OmpH family outer membrane protein [Parabacteroides sp.]
MKNINYVINGVLAVAVIILFVMQFSGKKESTVTPAFTTEGDSTTNLLPVAYVNVDSLLANYNYSKDLNERVLKMQEDYRLDMTQRSNALRTELTDFQRKYEANAFLTQERAQQEGNRLQKKQQELQDYATKKEQELATKQMELNGQLRDTIVVQLEAFNKTKGYQIIFSNTMGDNILLANHAYDITAEFLEVLNKNYSSAK